MASTNHTVTPVTPASAPASQPARRYVGRKVVVMRGETVTRGVIARAWVAKCPLTRQGLRFLTGHLTRARVVTADLTVIDVRPEAAYRLEFLPEVSHA